MILFQSLFFVELALDVYELHLQACDSSSFNPCFRGTCSWWRPSQERRRSLSFQSLFSWNLLLMHLGFPPPSHSWCFNPCFVELALDGAVALLYWLCGGVSILVFVELALDANSLRIASSSPISFNPCFRGTCSWCFLSACPQDMLPSFILVFVELALDVCGYSFDLHSS